LLGVARQQDRECTVLEADPHAVVVLLGPILRGLGEDRQDDRAQLDPARPVDRLDRLDSLVADQLQQGQVTLGGVGRPGSQEDAGPKPPDDRRHPAVMRLLGQRPRYQEGPPEGAVSVR
jgi:hypothetical protein